MIQQTFKPTVKNCGGKIQFWECYAFSGIEHLFAKNLKNKEDQGFQTVMDVPSLSANLMIIVYSRGHKRGEHIHLVLHTQMWS